MYGYFDGDLYVQGKRVIKDQDPVYVYDFIGPADTRISSIEQQTSQPETLVPRRLTVGVTPIPLSDVDLAVKRIHVKVPSFSPYFVYLGDENTQDYILEPGDVYVFEI